MNVKELLSQVAQRMGRWQGDGVTGDAERVQELGTVRWISPTFEVPDKVKDG